MRKNYILRGISTILAMLFLCLYSIPVVAKTQEKTTGNQLELIDLSNLNTESGYLYERANANYDRLESDQYNVQKAIAGDPSWPGDMQGRIILGLVSQAKTLHQREPVTLEAMMDEMEKNLIDGAFMNSKLNPDMANEQLFSGHSWFLRAMCELYQWNGDQRALNVINNLVQKLLIEGKPAIERYPIEHLSGGGGVSGEIIGQQNGWELSTDTGCIFMMLDGATHAYEVTHNQELKQVIDVLIQKFMKADVVDLKFQTHATLSATRGLLRFYQETNDKKYLDYALQRMNEYITYGMTEAYMNYNWYQRPEWTEPCAIIDSYLVAMELFRFTEDIAWLELGQKILYNGIGAAQRSNGGFGTDSCVGVSNQTLNLHGFEATQCCTMRGGEGTTKAIRYQYMIGQDNALYALQYGNNTLKFNGITLQQMSNYPEDGNVEFSVLDCNQNTNLNLCLFVPSFVSSYQVCVDGKTVDAPVENGFIHLNLSVKKGTKISFQFDLPVVFHNTKEQNGHISGLIYSKGFVELGWFQNQQNIAEQNLPFSERTLTPIYERFHLNSTEISSTPVQIISDRFNIASSGIGISSSGNYTGINDGNRTNGWFSESQETSNNSQWVGIGFDNICPIDIVSIYPSSSQGLPQSFTIEVSNNNKDWEVIQNVSGHNPSLPYILELEQPKQLQFIRITSSELSQMDDGKFYMAVGEVELYSSSSKVLSITSDMASISDQISINGKTPVSLPYQQLIFPGEEIQLQIIPNLNNEYTFYQWNGDIQSDKETIHITPQEHTNLIVEHAYSGIENLALGATVTSNNQMLIDPDWMPQNLTDGIYQYPNQKGANGFTSNGLSSQNVAEQPIEIQLDLGSNQQFNQIKLYPRTDCLAEDGTIASFPKDFTISIKGEQEEEFKTIYTAVDIQPEKGSPFTVLWDEIYTARYIKIATTKLGKAVFDNPTVYYLQLSEIVLNNTLNQKENYTLAVDGAKGVPVKVNNKQVTLPYTEEFKQGTKVTVEPIQDDFYSFSNWEGDIYQENPTQQIIMNTDHSLRLNVTQGTLLPHSEMTASATSETNPPDFINGPASFAIDDNPTTIWHTNYKTSGPVLPQSLTLQFQQPENIFQVVYIPRTDKDSKNGIIQKYQLEGLLQDGNWEVLSKGNWPGNNDTQSITIKPTKVTAIRLTALEAVGGYASCAELNVYVDNRMVPSGDKTVLNAIIAYAENAKASGEYDNAIESVQKSFDTALENAKTVAVNENASQEVIDQAWKTLLNEIHKLGFIAGDKESLASLIEVAKKIDLSKYVEAGQAEFTTALETAQRVYQDGDAMQEEINDVADNLLNAMLNLRFKADKSILEDVLAKANNIDATTYTAESYNILTIAINEAKMVLENENATQEEVDAAVQSVQAAMDQLVTVDGTVPEEMTSSTNDIATQTGQESTTPKANAAKTGDFVPIVGIATLAVAGVVLVLSRKKK
ncbi:discoidin domain-containing protein [Massilioclostridium coli]|uniref:discoidin domain-containing protein n=1 Tax=Massilioclostridium coli TaxID=1870991 RepID=UPI00085C76B0|nr:discoidin domain-containing protein [Massilioclostridium coli]